MISEDFDFDGPQSDVCIVGSGPVGLCLALDLADRGLSVLILESGLANQSNEAQSLSDAEIKKPFFHHDMSIATFRGLGGTSQLWGGRCVEFDAFDFLARGYMPNSGWPIRFEDVTAYFPRAAELLGFPSLYERQPESKLHNRGPIINKLEFWLDEPRMYRLFRRHQAADRIHIAFNATVVDIEFTPAKDVVTGLVVANIKGEKKKFCAAKEYVLASGGVETARLLLNVQARHPKLFGGRSGALGHYYMGHPAGTIARIKFHSAAEAEQFKYQHDAGFSIRRRFTFSNEVMESEQIPNIAFWPDNQELENAGHRSGLLSALYLLLFVPPFSRTMLSEAIRNFIVPTRFPNKLLQHLWNCVTDFRGLLIGGVQLLKQKVYDGRRFPRLFVLNADNEYPLHFHAEQIPDAQNLVYLSQHCDALGLRRAVIDFEFTDADAAGIYKAHVLLDRFLREAGIGELKFNIDEAEFVSTKKGCTPDGLHQIGTARMAADPACGVVDRDCRVFGVTNLSIAGSAVLPTSGQANPTFFSVALALRLAKLLHDKRKQDKRAGKLKIVHVISSIDVRSGGPARAVFDLAIAAKLLGHDVTICTSDHGAKLVDYTRYTDAGISVRIFPQSRLSLLERSAAMQEYLENNLRYFDIAHVHSMYLFHDWVMMRCAKHDNIPYILRPHGTLDPVIQDRKKIRKFIVGLLFQNRMTGGAVGIHFTSDDERVNSIYAPDHSWVVPLPVTAEEFERESANLNFKSDRGIRSDYVLFFGRLAWKKGLDILIPAFARFAEHYPDVALVIAGPDDGEQKTVTRLVRAHALENKVHLTGIINGPDRTAAYQQAKIFVLPSRGENFGRTVVEAAILGTPIIMTDRVGIWRLFQAADAACVVEPTIEAIADALITAWKDYSAFVARTEHAKTVVESNYGVAGVGRQLEEMYRDALKLHQAAHPKQCI